MSNRLKILFVDDELVILKALELVLGDAHDVITARKASEAFDILNQHNDIQVLVSDMRMPESDGLQLIKRVKKNRPEIKCYLLTGFEMNAEIAESIEDGTLIRLIQKPTELQVLIDTILSDFE
ncbi:MAG: response regulator [Cyclobacteriaceae bacterium]|nr:response regulator [Cyclobacteriaceae bacterium SS2]